MRTRILGVACLPLHRLCFILYTVTAIKIVLLLLLLFPYVFVVAGWLAHTHTWARLPTFALAMLYTLTLAAIPIVLLLLLLFPHVFVVAGWLAYTHTWARLPTFASAMLSLPRLQTIDGGPAKSKRAHATTQGATVKIRRADASHGTLSPASIGIAKRNGRNSGKT